MSLSIHRDIRLTAFYDERIRHMRLFGVQRFLKWLGNNLDAVEGQYPDNPWLRSRQEVFSESRERRYSFPAVAIHYKQFASPPTITTRDA